jgi:hypothetical protein
MGSRRKTPQPTFLGIGAQKAGTTWLYTMLRLHPQIGFATHKGKPMKEVHYWSVHRRHRGLDWYLSLFGDEPIQGDITPDYCMLAPAAIRDIHALNPAMRMIYTLRNPVERAWSATNMRVQLRREHLARQGRRESMPAVDETYLKRDFAMPGMMKRADYARNLRNWWRVFPRESVLVLRYEQILADPRGYLKSCAAHAGADPSFYDSVPDATLKQRVGMATGDIMPRGIYEHLLELHRGNVMEAEPLLGWDLSDWLLPYEAWLARRLPARAVGEPA